MQQITITEKQKKKLIEGIKKLLSKDKIMKDAKVSDKTFQREVQELKKSGSIPQEDYKTWIESRHKQNIKVTDSKLEQLIEGMLDGKPRYEIANELGIGYGTFPAWKKTALEKIAISEADKLKIQEWSRQQMGKSYENFVKQHGEEKAYRLWSKPKKYTRDSHRKIVQGARKGGQSVQRLFPEKMAENRSNRLPFGTHPQFEYLGTLFKSKEEATVAGILHKYGLIRKFDWGRTYQFDMPVPGKWYSRDADFYLPSREVVIEFHMTPINHEDAKYNSNTHYARKRKKELRETGYFGKVVVLTSTAAYHMYPRLKKAKLISDDFSKFTAKVGLVKEHIALVQLPF